MAGLTTEPLAPPKPLRPLEHKRGPVTWRSLLMGVFGVVLICAVTPYNDYALNNTFLVGNNLPIGVVMLTFLFVLFVNAPLHRWWPRQALSSGELGLALTMTLVGCALPSSGLMRYLPPALVSPFYLSLSNQPYQQLLESMHLPHWIYPSFSGSGPAQWMNDPIVIDYIGRWTEAGPPPYGAWVRPIFTWFIFIAALFGSLLCFVTIVRHQWFENERLAFPLAQIHLSIIEQPTRGHIVGRVLRARSFWIAFGLVFCLHGWNGLGNYFPRTFPKIPVYYDVLFRIMSNPPWVYVSNQFKTATVFFTVVGVSYFLTNSLAFSLWFFFLAVQVVRMFLGSFTGDPAIHGAVDQHTGGVTAFVISVLWVGRHHWVMVIKQALRGHRAGEPYERYLPYPVAVWTMLFCICVMIGWLWMAGCTLWGAAVVVLLLVTLYGVITRIIAESGLVHGQLLTPVNHPWVVATEYGHPMISPNKTFFLASMMQQVNVDYREVMPVYASHGMKILDTIGFSKDDSADDTAADRKSGRRVILAISLALVVAYFVSFGSTLWMEYKYAWTQDVSEQLPNKWGVLDSPRQNLVDEPLRYSQGDMHAASSPAGNFAFGFVLVAALAAIRLRFAAWPFHPIGFLMVYTYPGTHLWLSIFLGWLAKNVLLKFGGTRLYTAAKPFFLGMIVGEATAAGFWLILGIALSSAGLPFRPVNIMPG